MATPPPMDRCAASKLRVVGLEWESVYVDGLDGRGGKGQESILDWEVDGG